MTEPFRTEPYRWNWPDGPVGEPGVDPIGWADLTYRQQTVVKLAWLLSTGLLSNGVAGALGQAYDAGYIRGAADQARGETRPKPMKRTSS